MPETKTKTRTRKKKRGQGLGQGLGLGRGRGGDKNQPTWENYAHELNNDQARRLGSHNGSALSSRDNSYNDRLFVRESHNCYTYFLNLKSKDAVELCKKDFKNHNMCRRAQPGYLTGHPPLKKKDYACPVIEKRTLEDNPDIYKVKSLNDKCDPRFYKGAMVVAPGRDYHYYRLNDDGQWSHKPGYKPSTRFDSDNNLIVDPKLAARDYGGTLNYKDFCGYYCVPRNSNRKEMAHRGQTFENRNAVEKGYKEQGRLLKTLKIGKTRNKPSSLASRVASLLTGTRKNKGKKGKKGKKKKKSG